jgi:hypothetical protein
MYSAVSLHETVALLQTVEAVGTAPGSPSWNNVPWTALASVFAALISGVVTYLLARSKLREEIAKIEHQMQHQRRLMVADLRHQYITPLRHSASTLISRLQQIEEKQRHNAYGEVSTWFREVKDHADGNFRKAEFRIWSFYVGNFAMTTLYYMCMYFRCAREVMSKSPFRELDRSYAEELESKLIQIGRSFDWGQDGFWRPMQDIRGDRFRGSPERTRFEDLCEMIDSKEPLVYGPFILPLDVFIRGFDAKQTVRIRKALEDLVDFIDVRPNPEENAPER